MEKAGDELSVHLSIPSTDRWADGSSQQELRRSVEKSGDGTSQ
jgi:hypothetical protein